MPKNKITEIVNIHRYQNNNIFVFVRNNKFKKIQPIKKNKKKIKNEYSKVNIYYKTEKKL